MRIIAPGVSLTIAVLPRPRVEQRLSGQDDPDHEDRRRQVDQSQVVGDEELRSEILTHPATWAVVLTATLRH